MRKVILLGIGVSMSLAAASETRPAISVNSSGKALARPDVAIVFLQVRSQAPLANDALEQNRKKVAEVRAKLKALGYKEEQVKFTGNRFSPTGQGIYYSGGQRPTGFDVYNNLFVFLEEADLKDAEAFNGKAGALLDELSKIGAQTLNLPISSISMGGASVIAFAVKNAAAYEKQAYQEAMEKARPIADDIAKRMKVNITGIDAVNVIQQGRQQVIGGPANPLDELPYEYLSTSIDEVPVRVRLDVRYTYTAAR